MLNTDILLERQQIPDKGPLIVKVDEVVEIVTSAEEARRRVSVFVLTEIGNLLHGGTPTLVIGERIAWRVPVLLTRPSFGILGQVGNIDVDVTSGELINPSQSTPSIESNAQALIKRLASSAASTIG